MKIALFSPVNPIPSGISDYTEELIPELVKFWDVDLYVEKGFHMESTKIRDLVNIIEYDSKIFKPENYDEIIYHMGNNLKAHKYIYNALLQFKGVVVLHDYMLQGFYAEKYDFDRDKNFFIELQKKYYDNIGKEIADYVINELPHPILDTSESINYPLNEEIITNAKSLIVHSKFLKDLIEKKFNTSVYLIPHHGHNIKKFNTEKIRTDLGVSQDDILICSTGFINKNKRVQTILSALDEINVSNIKYLIQGKDNCSLMTNIPKKNKVKIIRKGYVSLEELEGYICSSDICVNLRYPTMGESSGSLLRMMSYGKPVLVTNGGSYSNFPDYTVIKVDPDILEKEMIKKSVLELIKDKDFRFSIGREARNYVERECSIKRCASLYDASIKGSNLIK